MDQEKTDVMTKKSPIENQEPVVEVGNEFPEYESDDVLDPKDVEQWKAQYPNSKFGFFMHVNDSYVYRSYTTKELKELTVERKKQEEVLKRELTDDEFLVLMLDKFVVKPTGIGQMLKEESLSAGIPHLLYDLINHLSGFAKVEPVIL